MVRLNYKDDEEGGLLDYTDTEDAVEELLPSRDVSHQCMFLILLIALRFACRCITQLLVE